MPSALHQSTHVEQLEVLRRAAALENKVPSLLRAGVPTKLCKVFNVLLAVVTKLGCQQGPEAFVTEAKHRPEALRADDVAREQQVAAPEQVQRVMCPVSPWLRAFSAASVCIVLISVTPALGVSTAQHRRLQAKPQLWPRTQAYVRPMWRQLAFSWLVQHKSSSALQGF